MEIVVLLTCSAEQWAPPISLSRDHALPGTRSKPVIASPLSSHTKLHRNVLDTLLNMTASLFHSSKFSQVWELQLSSWTRRRRMAMRLSCPLFSEIRFPDVTWGGGLVWLQKDKLPFSASGLCVSIFLHFSIIFLRISVECKSDMENRHLLPAFI